MAADPHLTAVSLYFQVTVDSYPLGAFTACEGLAMEVVVEQREEGGNNGFVHMIPGRIKYSNIKLTRPLNQDSALISKWFASMNGMVKRGTASIVAKNHDATPVATWSLSGVIPVKWTGPSLNVETGKVATETLELAHHGFLEQMGAA
jgi:phage tail-like protein